MRISLILSLIIFSILAVFMFLNGIYEAPIAYAIDSGGNCPEGGIDNLPEITFAAVDFVGPQTISVYGDYDAGTVECMCGSGFYDSYAFELGSLYYDILGTGLAGPVSATNNTNGYANQCSDLQEWNYSFQEYIDISGLGPGDYTIHLSAANSNDDSSDQFIPFTIIPPPPPSVNIFFDGSDGPVTVNPGYSGNLSWTVSGNATSCTASGGWSGGKTANPNNSESSGPINSPTTFTIDCTGPGGTSPQDSVTVNVFSVNSAQCIGISAPAEVNAGQTFSASITMMNNGTTSWTSGADYRLGSQNSRDNTRWGTSRVSLSSEPIGPGVSTIFTYNFIAPDFPTLGGVYPFDWAMVQDGVEWFGETCTGSIRVKQKMYACRTDLNYTCNQTSSYYADRASCEANLAIYLPGQTTGFCYQTLAGCEAECNPPLRHDFGMYLPPPTVNSITISSPTVIPDGVTTYNITETSMISTGGANIRHQYIIINYQGTNSGAYRGFIAWDSTDGGGWSGTKDNQACSPLGSGGWASIQNTGSSTGYGHDYLELVSCSSSISGNSRTVVYTVAFNPNFGVDGPLTNNDISGYAYSAGWEGSGWVNFETNFNLSVPPTVSNVTLAEPTYCGGGPGGDVSWSYSDPGSNPQRGRRVQVDNDSNFSSPLVDSCPSGSNCGGGASRNYTIPQGVLAFNTIYYARVMAWNNAGLPSTWANMTICNGYPVSPGGCQAGNTSWRTPVNAWPDNRAPNYHPNVFPSAPPVSFPATFTDRTNFSAAPSAWLWNFGDAQTSTLQNPTHTYTLEGIYQVTVRSTDVNGYSCTSSQRQVSVGKAIPIWKEIRPK
ncbi:MAG: hypothetical protein A2925_04580 [Candidatus Yanofskybacteria bacterium RIFCSPLOWO2_01_FULL_44_22]|uniref:PKD domain-containing protein n=2 Tax=Candidatus Yanofskyibacteriota TaxID=1752733 RepID=A0A1F8GMR4_9BACT|nr:MAG: xylosidase/arabinosidase [Candidatus Yanofskybacteria bacterium GW2011_GWA2_44_9]OGN04021.1 MAG: hypothetical protein A2659_00200 [Candidatus Yanofskybacteria bacterium RIFCSPHIGHO2_01_FULL_44_24]OGN25978.1 MAG: hypothetical protein A2925_04580 [Candidatus Yanofskybacteria bacterium RIFCSPLOWO2_01_FULL_44_22]